MKKDEKEFIPSTPVNTNYQASRRSRRGKSDEPITVR